MTVKPVLTTSSEPKLDMQAKGGKQMFGRSWGRLEAELARTLHETFGLVADRLPWDTAEDNLAFRHMPEARCCPAVCTKR